MRLTTNGTDVDVGVAAIDSVVESYVKDQRLALDIAQAVMLRLTQMGWKPANREEGQ